MIRSFGVFFIELSRDFGRRIYCMLELLFLLRDKGFIRYGFRLDEAPKVLGKDAGTEVFFEKIGFPTADWFSIQPAFEYIGAAHPLPNTECKLLLFQAQAATRRPLKGILSTEELGLKRYEN